MGIIEERHGAPCRTARAANERRRPSSPPAFFPDNRGSRRTPDRPPERNVKEKENMPRTPAKKSKAATAAHPPYVSMVKEAIVAMKDTYSLPENFTTTLSRFLKKYVESGELVKVKASYKLGTLKNEPKKKVVKKKKVIKKKVVKKKKPTTTKAPKKKIAKKPKKAAPKKKKAPKKKTTKKR